MDLRVGDCPISSLRLSEVEGRSILIVTRLTERRLAGLACTSGLTETFSRGNIDCFSGKLTRTQVTQALKRSSYIYIFIIMTIYICFLAKSNSCSSSKPCPEFLLNFLHLALLYFPHRVPLLLLPGSPCQLRTLLDEFSELEEAMSSHSNCHGGDSVGEQGECSSSRQGSGFEEKHLTLTFVDDLVLCSCSFGWGV